MIDAAMLVRCLVFGLVLVMTGCSTFSGQEPAPAPPAGQAKTSPPPPVPTPQPPARPPQPSTSSAWKPLVQKAEQAAGRGDYEQALALLERAQRIDPESGEIYLQMARTHLARGNTAQSRATAERGMLYCQSNAQCDALRSLVR